MIKNAKKEDVTVIFGEKEVMFLVFLYLFFVTNAFILFFFITDRDYFQVLHVEKGIQIKILL